MAAKFAKHLCRATKIIKFYRQTIRKLSCASWRTSAVTLAYRLPLRLVKIFTKQLPPQIFQIDPADVDAEQRRRAKTVNFGIIYGLSPFGLASRLSIPLPVAKK